MCFPAATTAPIGSELKFPIEQNDARLLEDIQHDHTGTSRQRRVLKRRGERHFIVVHHNYHDHANDTPRPEHQDDDEAVKGPLVMAIASRHTTFPMKLYDMLERIEDQGLCHIVSWQPHGRSFRVHDPKAFLELLPHYTSQTKIASFHRQLNLYGFLRISQGADQGAYYHERFLRGRRHLLWGMTRCRIKGTGIRARSNPEQEPNFWQMAWVDKQRPALEQTEQLRSSGAMKWNVSSEDGRPQSVPSDYQAALPTLTESREHEVIDTTGMKTSVDEEPDPLLLLAEKCSSLEMTSTCMAHACPLQDGNLQWGQQTMDDIEPRDLEIDRILRNCGNFDLASQLESLLA